MICDTLIVGGGIIGLCLAKKLISNYPEMKILIIEKEIVCGEHASGRNSGVLHAGFYYTADSLKARFSRDGNKAWKDFCYSEGIKVRKCGKLVVATNEVENTQIDELLTRAKSNGVDLSEIDKNQANEIQNGINTDGRILYSPSTACVDPKKILEKLTGQLIELGVKIVNHCKYLKRGNGDKIAITSKGKIHYSKLVNCAGLYADKIAKGFNLSKNYSILPFKGLYIYCDPLHIDLKTNIYPVPDLKNPFLGVHFTLTADGKAKIGPTAIPAFWRENYGGLFRFNLEEAISITTREIGLFINSNFGFRGLALEELKKYRTSYLAQLAGKLLPNFKESDFGLWGKPGIRAQLFDTKNRNLVTDFVVEKEEHSLHVLNAISPAFTCAIPFCNYLCDQFDFQ